MTELELYEELMNFIKEKSENAIVSNLEDYYKPECELKPQTYLERLASSLQNSGMMHNSIRFNESKEIYNRVKATLCNFDIKKIKFANADELYNAVTVNGTKDNGRIRINKKEIDEKVKAKKLKQTNWRKYADGLFDGIKYLNNGGDSEIKELCKEPSNEKELKEKIKKLKKIQNRITGLGFALTCDWIKECGATWLAKPDIHIKIVCSAFYDKNDLKDEEIVELMWKFSNEVRKTYPDASAYKIDKIIWLICTGNFYLNRDKINRESIIIKINGE